MKEKLTNKVLGAALVCLMMASTLGALPSTVHAAKLDMGNNTRMTDKVYGTQSVDTTYRSPVLTPANPGQGKIAFSRDANGGSEICVINPDGSGLVVLSQKSYSPAWSPDGTKIAFMSQREHNQDIYIMNADGTGEMRITYSSDWDWGPLAWSPDGRKIAFTRRPFGDFLGVGQIWITNADGSGQVQLTNYPEESTSPSWSPDGTKIAFASHREGGEDIWVMNADGSGQTNLIEDPDWEFGDEDPAWSPDGSKIAFVSRREGESDRNIYVMNTDGSDITRLTTPIGDNHAPSWSPNGTRIAFASNRDGNYEIYIMNADGTNETRVTYDPVNESQPSWGIAADTGMIEEEPDIGPVSPVDFGNVILGSNLDKTTTIYNDGNATLTINSITSSGSSDFTYISPSTPFNIAAGGSQVITIRFTPSYEGTQSAIFNISSNDPAEANVTFSVSGKGVAQGGSIEVRSDPPGASFILDGPTTYTGITPWSTDDAPVGTYTITWHPMDGYQTSPQESKPLTQGGTVSFYGSYSTVQETVSTPNAPTGPSSGEMNQSLSYSTGGASSNLGHSLQYRFDWGNGSYSGWSSSTSASHSWSNSGTYSVRAQARCASHTSITSSWSTGLAVSIRLPPLTSVSCFDCQTCYSTEEEAVSHVPDHVVPRDCFVWNDGPRGYPWRVIPGTGCAHWVAHQLDIRTGATCYDGYSIRVEDVIAGRVEVGIDSCKVGDIWTDNDCTHCGIVRQLGDGKVLVEHDSSAEGGVVTSLLSSGKCWSESLMPEAEPFPGANAGNLWEYYSAWGKELPPPSERAKIYEALGLGSADSYVGSSEQNTRLLDALKDRQICPSTGEEVNWVAPSATLAQLIQQETTESIPVTVDGRQYFIVTLKNRIDPNSFEIVSGSGATKLYVDVENQPVSNPEIAQKIGVIDYAWYLQQGIGSIESISQRYQHVRDLWDAHEQIEAWQLPRQLLPKAAATFIRAYVSGGTLTLQDFVDFASQATDLSVKLFADPMRLAVAMIDQDLYDAEASYHSALKAARDNIRDHASAYAYLRNYLEAQVYYELPANHLLAEIDEIDKDLQGEITDFFTDVADEIAGGYYGNVEEACHRFAQIQQITQYQTEKSEGYSLVDQILNKALHKAAPYTLELAQSPRIAVEVHSPVELRVYDSQGRVTGIVNGEEKNEIPYSAYYNDTVTIFSPTDSYSYEVAGTGEGTYDLTVTTVAEQSSTFTLASVPTSPSAVHQYTIDWDALFEGKKGATMKIDSDGDGTFEEIKKLGQEGAGFSGVWIVVAGVSGLVGVLAGAFIVRRRIGKKQGAQN